MAVLTFLSGLFLACPSYANKGELDVWLDDVIYVRAQTFYLGEYAKIRGDKDVAAAASLAVINVRGGALFAQRVIDAIKAQGIGDVKLRLHMYDPVIVEPEDELERRFRTDSNWQWRVEAVTDVPVSPDLPLLRDVKPGASSASLVYKDARGRQKFVRVWLKWFQPVVVPRANMQKGSVLEAGDIYMELGLMESFRALAYDAAQVTGKVLRFSAVGGAPIGLDNVTEEMIVKAGSLVLLGVNINGAYVGVNGVAVDSGGMGDTIKVRNEATRKIVVGVVVGRGKVEVISEGVSSDVENIENLKE